MTIESLKKAGWIKIETFGISSIIMAKKNQRIVVEKSGKIIIQYLKTR
jgi:hypothetical protein